MASITKIDILYGFKCIRPEQRVTGLSPGQWVEYDPRSGPPIVTHASVKPRCDYCGHITHEEGYKCKSCGAPK